MEVNGGLTALSFFKNYNGLHEYEEIRANLCHPFLFVVETVESPRSGACTGGTKDFNHG
jgi:hypothetical protein